VHDCSRTCYLAGSGLRGMRGFKRRRWASFGRRCRLIRVTVKARREGEGVTGVIGTAGLIRVTVKARSEGEGVTGVIGTSGDGVNLPPERIE